MASIKQNVNEIPLTVFHEGLWPVDVLVQAMHHDKQTAGYRPVFFVVVDLNPDTERDACPGPEHHHGGLETGGIMAAVVYDDLRDQLWTVSETNIPIHDEVKLIMEIGRDDGRHTAPRVPSTLAATGTSMAVSN
ncbi:hypothetical protein KCV03_g212, partial [Aureobasidium melanogenum]